MRLRQRHKQSLAFFLFGMVAVALMGWLVDGRQWPLAVAGYLLTSVPGYAVWDWIERRKERADRQSFPH